MYTLQVLKLLMKTSIAYFQTPVFTESENNSLYFIQSVDLNAYPSAIPYTIRERCQLFMLT